MRREYKQEDACLKFLTNVAGIVVNSFVITLMVLPDSYAMNGETPAMETRLIFSLAVGNSRNGSLISLKNVDFRLSGMAERVKSNDICNDKEMKNRNNF